MAKRVDDRQLSLLDLLDRPAEQSASNERGRTLDREARRVVPEIIGFDRRFRWTSPGMSVETSYSEGADGKFYHGFSYWTGQTGSSVPDMYGAHATPEDALAAAAKDVVKSLKAIPAWMKEEKVINKLIAAVDKGQLVEDDYSDEPWRTHPVAAALRAAGLEDGSCGYRDYIVDPALPDGISSFEARRIGVTISWYKGEPRFQVTSREMLDSPITALVEKVTGRKVELYFEPEKPSKKQRRKKADMAEAA